MAINQLTVEMADSYFNKSLSIDDWDLYDTDIKELALFTSELEIKAELNLTALLITDDQVTGVEKPGYELMAIYEWALLLLQSKETLRTMLFNETKGVTECVVHGLGSETYLLHPKDKIAGPRKRLLRNSIAGTYLKALRSKAITIR